MHAWVYNLDMVGVNPERQYLNAREHEMWVEAGEAAAARIERMNGAELVREQRWIEYIHLRVNELAEELLKLQGVISDAEVITFRPREQEGGDPTTR